MKLNFSAKGFKAEHFQQSPVHIKSAFDPVYFSWTDLDELLYVFDVNDKTVRLMLDQLIPESEFSELSGQYGIYRKTFNKACVYDTLSSGGTLVLNRAEQKSLRIRKLCNAVSAVASGQVVANGYLAAGGSSAFGNHWDSHDVFATQLLGRKRWVIYPPTFPDPIVGQKSVDFKADCPTEHYLDVITEPGDMLYIPRGWWHCAYPSEGPCFHVALGVHKPYVIDYLGWLSANVLSKDRRFRKVLELDGKHLIDDVMISDISCSIGDFENLKAFETQVFNKESFDSGLNFSEFYGLNLEALGSVFVKLSTPFEHIVERAKISVNGVHLLEHVLGQYLRIEEQSLSELRDKAEPMADIDFVKSLQSLISSGVASFRR